MAIVDSVSITGDTREDWRIFVEARQREELDRIIADEGLRPAETRVFVAAAFRDGAVPTTGTAITRILPPVSRFSPEAGHAAKKQTVIGKLLTFFDRYFGLT